MQISSCAQVASGVATAEEAEECISSEFNPVRAGFRGSPDVWTRDVLNLGVRPDKIIAKARLPLACQRTGVKDQKRRCCVPADHDEVYPVQIGVDARDSTLTETSGCLSGSSFL